MKTLFDTSVLVAAMIEPHPMHSRALPWLKRAKARELDFFVACHTLAELYAVLTTLPLSPKISPATAKYLILENVKSQAKIVTLSQADYISVISKMTNLGLRGGSIYDALIAKSAQKAGADHILTFNYRDFMRVWPDGINYLIEP